MGMQVKYVVQTSLSNTDGLHIWNCYMFHTCSHKLFPRYSIVTAAEFRGSQESKENEEASSSKK